MYSRRLATPEPMYFQLSCIFFLLLHEATNYIISELHLVAIMCKSIRYLLKQIGIEKINILKQQTAQVVNSSSCGRYYTPIPIFHTS